MKHVTVREYAWISSEPRGLASLDVTFVDRSAFDWIRQTHGPGRSTTVRPGGGSEQWLRLDNYVGLIETPCGTRLEIVPKHYDGEEIESARALLRRMVTVA